MTPTISRSAFIDHPIEETSPFSFRDIFKKKEETAVSATSSTASTSKDSGSGIGSGILSGIAGLFSVGASLATVAPQIGIGSKSRIAETNATAAANAQILNAQNQLLLTQQKTDDKKQNLLILGGVGLFLLIIIVVVMLKK